MRRTIVFLLLFSPGILCPALAQCPATDFTSPASGCRNEALPMANLSAPGSYIWDFCSGDFNLTPSAQLAFTLAGVNGRPGIEFAFDNKWFAFVTGTFGSLMYRLEFDNGLQAAPTNVTNLGNLGGTLNQPGQLRIIQEGTQWYGILHSIAGDLLKLSFGAQLSNVPVVTTLITGIGYTNSGLAIGKDVVDGYVCVVSSAANQFSIIRLGNLLAVPNPVSDVITSAAVPNPNNLGDLDIINVCGNWYGISDNLGNGNIYRMDFGTSLFSAPAITQIQSVAVSNPGRLRLAKEGEEYFFLMMTLDGVLIKGAFGASITSVPAIANEGNMSGVLPANMYGLAMVKENSAWTILGVNQANGQVYRTSYTDNCSASPRESSLSNPTVAYAQAGTYSITLETQTVSGRGAKSRTVTISGSDAPDIDFSTQNSCAAANVLFTSINASSNIISYNWDFDDGQSAILADPAHSYATSGTYDPKLTVAASNGCTNFVTHPLVIFNAPLTDFTLPAITPVCTNQAYAFSNTSTIDPGSNPTWEWRINGILVGTQQDLSSIFTNAVSHEIRLKATIPGCENESIKNIATVLPGPMVSFGVADDCALSLVPFSNTTTGADAGYSWNFGDGTPTSSVAEPVHSFAVAGTYQVTLTGSNAAGCQNETILSVTIYSVPQPDFSVGLPPFSCSNTPTLFSNTTPPLADSNVSSWLWDFGDGTGAGAQSPSHTYSAGADYTVSLSATTDFGCTNTSIKTITIGTSPIADFAMGPSCVNAQTQFNDISSGSIQSRVWQIASGIFSTPNPTYMFTVPGGYTASLTVTAPDGCTSAITRPVDVPVPPLLSFTTINPCAGQGATFADASTMVPDPVVGWTWNMDGNSVTGNPASFSFPTPGLFNVKMTTTHASGCQYTASSNITIHPSPTASFMASPDRGEPPLTVQFENLSLGANQYAWLFTGNPPATSTQTSPVYTFIDLGEYMAQLTATNSFGCADVQSKDIVVLVPAIDLVLTGFSLSPDAINGQLRSTITITNNSNIPLQTAEVALHLSEKAMVSEAVTMNLEPGESGTQTLSFTFSPDQLDARFVCAEILSEKDIAQDNNKRCLSFTSEDYIFAPYPNPSTGTVQIDWVSEKAGSAQITVYNSLGKREYEWETASAAGLNQSVHDFSFLSAGMYFITIQTATSLQTLRFLRQ